MTAEKEEEILKKRLSELVNRAYFSHLCRYTSFLNLNEQNIFLQNQKLFSKVKFCFWGGHENAERRMLCFYPDDLNEDCRFPISTIKISPVHNKYYDHLSHRDYLGAILNLGIDRSKIGDILVEDKYGYVFVEENLEEFIMTTLEKVKHTSIKCTRIEERNFSIVPKMKEIKTTVSSVRLDAVLAAAFQASRSSLVSAIGSGKIFVNGRLIENNGYKLQEGDVISAKGMGKFIYKGMTDKTKKDRCKITISKFI